jgi:hypothetical protein
VALLTAGFHWVKIDIEKAPGQMFTCLYGCSVIPVFPENALPKLLLVVNLPDSACHKLHQPWDGHFIFRCKSQEMDMV